MQDHNRAAVDAFSSAGSDAERRSVDDVDDEVRSKHRRRGGHQGRRQIQVGAALQRCSVCDGDVLLNCYGTAWSLYAKWSVHVQVLVNAKGSPVFVVPACH